MAVLTFITERYVINIQNSFTALLGHFKMIRELIQCHQIVAGDYYYFFCSGTLSSPEIVHRSLICGMNTSRAGLVELDME